MRPNRPLIVLVMMTLAATAATTLPGDVQAVGDLLETTDDSRPHRRQHRKTTVAGRLRRHESLFTDTSQEARGLRQATLFARPAKPRTPSTDGTARPVNNAPKEEPAASLAVRVASPEYPVNIRREERTQRTVVFLVHGTYGETAKWFLEVPGHATFASELRRALGPSDIVVQFLWASANSHAARIKAARNLAALIRTKTTPTDRIAVVGHSHGGNVALQAIGECDRTIDILVCLSTPHLTFPVQAANGKRYHLPIYFPPESGKRIRDIVSITPSTDGMIPFAQYSPGIDTDDAIAATRSWQDHLKGVSLVAQRHWLAELFFGAVGSAPQMVRAANSLHLRFSPQPGVLLESHNISYISSIHNGQDAHSSVHSRRLGFLTGCLTRYGVSTSKPYLSTYTEALDSNGQGGGLDLGEPVRIDPHMSAIRARRTNGTYMRSGWHLMKVIATAPEYRLPDDTVPDLYYRLRQTLDGRDLFKSDTFHNTRSLQSSPLLFLPGRGQRSLFWAELWDWNLIDDNLRLGLPAMGVITAPQEKQSSFVFLKRDVQIETDQWSATFSWRTAHH